MTRDPTGRRPGVRQFWIGLAILGLAGAAALYAIPALSTRTRGGDVPPTYLAVHEVTFVESVPAPGTLQAWQRTEVRAATSGTVAWTAETGDRVRAGEVVARLDTVPLERAEQDARLAYERAERQLASALVERADAERTQRSAVEQAERRVAEAHSLARERASQAELASRLATLGAETPAALRQAQDAADEADNVLRTALLELDDARAAREARLNRADKDIVDAEASLAQAEVGLQRAREDLAAATRHAPLSGVIDAVEAPAGSVVNQHAAIVALLDDERLRLVAQVDETEIGRVRTGLTAKVSVTAAPERAVSATVVAIAPSARTVQNIPVFDVTLEIPNPGLALRPGMTAEAEIVLREVPGTITVPSRAVQFASSASRPASRSEAGGVGAAGTASAVPSAGRTGSAQRVGSGDPARIASPGVDPARLDAARTAWTPGAAGAGPSSASIRVRSGGVVSEVPVEVIATIGASTVLRADLPAGAEVEVPPVSAAAAPAGATGLPFGIGGIRVPGGFR